MISVRGIAECISLYFRLQVRPSLMAILSDSAEWHRDPLDPHSDCEFNKNKLTETYYMLVHLQSYPNFGFFFFFFCLFFSFSHFA